jgi:hypothetical protein
VRVTQFIRASAGVSVGASVDEEPRPAPANSQHLANATISSVLALLNKLVLVRRPMSEDIAERKARLAEQAAAIEREMAELAELERLAAKYNLVVSVTEVPKETEYLLNFSKPSSPPISPHRYTDAPALDGTFAGLVGSYRTHPKSPVHDLKHRVRNGYILIFDKLVGEIGSRRLSDIDADEIMRLYNKWAEGGKYAWGHALVGKMRLLFAFGMNVLKDSEATRLSVVMSKLRFKIPEARTERLTVDHVNAIRAAAHRHFGWHSIALAQALQFELMLKQADVIGEWVPASELGISEIFKGSEKWVRGIRWSSIDDDLILRHTIYGGRRHEPKEIEIDLKQAPMVMEELALVGDTQPRTGPMIICEANGLPWSANEFRRKWRMVANEAGIPMNVKNMDSGKADQPIARTLPSGTIRKEIV